MRTQHALALSTGKAGKRVGTYLRVGAVYSILLVFLFETPKALGGKEQIIRRGGWTRVPISY